MDLQSFCYQSPVGTLIAIADQKALYLLEFVDGHKVRPKLEKIKKETGLGVSDGQTPITVSLGKELRSYFSGDLLEFDIPLHILGSPFQKSVWQQLNAIPLGETRSYAEIAQSIAQPTAFRAVANANAANRFAIIIPCHRVINSDGGLGGYGGGLDRKRWLLKHERAWNGVTQR